MTEHEPKTEQRFLSNLLPKMNSERWKNIATIALPIAIAALGIGIGILTINHGYFREGLTSIGIGLTAAYTVYEGNFEKFSQK